MIKKVRIQYDPKRYEEEFIVGNFAIVEHPFKTKRLLPEQLVYWANKLARIGLIFHSEYDGKYIFRVDGDVLEQLNGRLRLKEDSLYGSSQDGLGGDHAVKTRMSLTLTLDEEAISSVDLI